MMTVEVKCKQLDEQGMGVFYAQGKRYVCKDLLENERALVEIHRNHVQLVKHLETSKERTKFK